MLERLHFLIAPAGRGYRELRDGETGEVVGHATRRASRPYWIPAAFRRSGVTEAREPPDGSLVFTLHRKGRGADLTDGQDQLLWRYRPGPRGWLIAAAKGTFIARVRLVGEGVYGVERRSGDPLASITRAGPDLHAECVADTASKPFDKMLVLGAALHIQMHGGFR